MLLIIEWPATAAYVNLGQWLNLNQRYHFLDGIGLWSDVLAAVAFGILCFPRVKAARRDIPMEGK
jgi:hypothetical protein